MAAATLDGSADDGNHFPIAARRWTHVNRGADFRVELAAAETTMLDLTPVQLGQILERDHFGNPLANATPEAGGITGFRPPTSSLRPTRACTAVQRRCTFRLSCRWNSTTGLYCRRRESSSSPI